jgi:hypothetical protein
MDASSEVTNWVLYHLFTYRLFLCYTVINTVVTQMVIQYSTQIRQHLSYFQP